ncbi:MAG: glycosyltransferase family 4 protein [Ignavibacteria bacterium]|nr:glycosyltransferase family 4 protein [Ignavibacteria bacterium]
MRKLSILLLNALDIYGGGEFYVYQLAKILKSRGYAITVSCRNDNLLHSKCRQAGINIFPVEYPENSGTGKVRKISGLISRYITDNRIDIVHSNTNYDRTVGAFAARSAGIKHVSNVHSLHKTSHNITHWFRNKYLIHHFIADGNRVRDLLMREDNIPENKITSISLGLDLKLNKMDIETREKIRNEFGIRNDEILIGNSARMVPFKGQEYLLRAFCEVNKQAANIRLMIVGDGELSDFLKNLSVELGINDKVIFTGFRSDIKEMYSAFDIYAHTSIEGGGEAFPFAILYALANELPLVITNVGDMSEMADNGVNGFILNEKDVKGISDKLAELCRDKKLRNTMGKKSRDLLERKFSADKMADDIEKVYYKVIKDII